MFSGSLSVNKNKPSQKSNKNSRKNIKYSEYKTKQHS